MNARLIGLAGLALAPAIGVLNQPKRGPLEGVWQGAELTYSTPAGPETLRPGPNITIFTARHYSRTNVQTLKPRPALANPANATADELREVWGPLVAEAGTYELKDNLITVQPVVSKSPSAMAPGVSMVYSYKIEGGALILTAQRDQNGPVARPYSVKLVRLE